MGFLGSVFSVTFFTKAIIKGVPLLYGATGEILTEKSGHLNLGIPGIMDMGGIGGILGFEPLVRRITSGLKLSINSSLTSALRLTFTPAV